MLLVTAIPSGWTALENYKVIKTKPYKGGTYATIFIFYGGNGCPNNMYKFREGTYAVVGTGAYRNGCAHKSIL